MPHSPKGRVSIHLVHIYGKNQESVYGRYCCSSLNAKDLDNAPLKLIDINTMNNLAYFLDVKEEPDGKPWYQDVKTFLKGGTYPLYDNAVDRRTI